MLLKEAKQILNKYGYRLVEDRYTDMLDAEDDEYLAKIRHKNTIVAKDGDHLSDLIKQEIKQNGPTCSLNHIDVSNVTDMSYLFADSNFNGDISKWDVSNVTNMEGMFENAKFNGDISNWDVSSVTNMSYMFNNSMFDGDISKWDVSNVTDMKYMFYESMFNNNISNWNVSSVTDMSFMFTDSDFNGDISKWESFRNITRQMLNRAF